MALADTPTDAVLDALRAEREKFSDADEQLIWAMCELLIERGEYPMVWNGNPINVRQRVQGYGAYWHRWTGTLDCPQCKADLRDQENGPPFTREIGLYDVGMDRTRVMKCPDCGHEWSQLT
jgi:hypothetical protein